MAGFTLRPMEASDGPGLDALMRGEPQSGGIAVSTHYEHDVVRSLLAQHPTMFGVVAESQLRNGLVGMATAFTTQVTVGGAVLPAAILENLKVRHDMRRQGLGTRLATWRIEEATRRFGGDGVIRAGIQVDNTASLATAGHWATQLLGPVRVVIERVGGTAPRMPGLDVRPIEDTDVDAVVEAVNAYHAHHELFPRQTADTLVGSLTPTPFDGPIRQYRVAAEGSGTIVAGARVMERYKLMTDHLDRVPTSLALLSRVVPVIPHDRVIRAIELDLVWHAPGRAAAVRGLLDAIRYEWRDRATNASAVVDPRGPLATSIGPGSWLSPRVRLMVAVRSPVRIDPDRPLYTWR